MSIVANYHTHNELCNHATGNCEDYVREAIRLNMMEIGLSDHNPIPTFFMTKKEYVDNWCQRNMTEEQFYDVYLPQMDDVISKYGNQIKIYKGLECEYIKEFKEYYEKLRKDLDYMNLGVHFFKNKKGEIVNSYSSINYNNVLEYADACVEGMKSGLFKILVHPDLFMFSYQNKEGKREFDEAAICASKMIIEASIQYGVYLEVNCNGIANSKKYHSKDWLYPFIDFWRMVKQYKEAKVIIGIDAHHVESLDGEDINLVKDFIERIGLDVKKTVVF